MAPNEFEAITNFLLQDRQDAHLLEGVDGSLAELACVVAIDPASPQLRAVFVRLIDAGARPSYILAALTHAVGYVGILNTRTAYDMFCSVWAETHGGDPLFKETFEPIPSDRTMRVELGKHLYGQFDPTRASEQAERFATISDLYYPRALEISGLTLRSQELPLRQRQIMTVAMLSCMGIEPQLAFHIGVALRNGVGREELTGILLFVQIYAGMPRANGAALIARNSILQANSSPPKKIP